ncbi:hypothetical protein GQR58_018335 [Nymphon striatum]|nr:hypothetical protein GQR58_018335 [Nymphon striatum]
MKCAAALLLCVTGAHADPIGDFDAFEACIPYVADQFPDHQFLAKVTSRACGTEFFAREQSCNLPEYLLFDTAENCRAEDLQFWQSEVSYWEDTLEVTRLAELVEGDAYCRSYYAIDPILVEDSSSAMAQDFDYDPAVLAMCLENAETSADRTYCIGQGAQTCAETEAGQSTPGLAYCYGSEWEDWDARLNAVYQDLLVQQAELAIDNAAFNPNIPDAVDTLRAMQRSWITYRDDACLWDVVQWSGGTGGGPSSAACMMRLTALQTLLLEEYCILIKSVVLAAFFSLGCARRTATRCA